MLVRLSTLVGLSAIFDYNESSDTLRFIGASLNSTSSDIPLITSSSLAAQARSILQARGSIQPNDLEFETRQSILSEQPVSSVTYLKGNDPDALFLEVPDDQPFVYGDGIYLKVLTVGTLRQITLFGFRDDWVLPETEIPISPPSYLQSAIIPDLNDGRAVLAQVPILSQATPQLEGFLELSAQFGSPNLSLQAYHYDTDVFTGAEAVTIALYL